MKSRYIMLPYLLETFLCAMFLNRTYPWHRSIIFINFFLAFTVLIFSSFAWGGSARYRPQNSGKTLFFFSLTFLLLCSVLFCGWVFYTAAGNVLQASMIGLLHLILGVPILFFCRYTLNAQQ